MKSAIITLIAAFTLTACGMFVGLLFGVYLAQPRYVPPENIMVEYPTGKEVLAELQKYRVSQGLPEFELTPGLCSNIGSRWQNYKENNSHEGFEEFLKANRMDGKGVAEILVSGKTAQEMVKQWSESPSHDYFIKHNSKICVYSLSGLSVALLSN